MSGTTAFLMSNRRRPSDQCSIQFGKPTGAVRLASAVPGAGVYRDAALDGDTMIGAPINGDPIDSAPIATEFAPEPAMAKKWISQPTLLPRGSG